MIDSIILKLLKCKINFEKFHFNVDKLEVINNEIMINKNMRLMSLLKTIDNNLSDETFDKYEKFFIKFNDTLEQKDIKQREIIEIIKKSNVILNAYPNFGKSYLVCQYIMN